MLFVRRVVYAANDDRRKAQMDRDGIVEYLKEFSIKKPYVNAMWLEGADGIGQVDEYSDIDVWFDVEKSHQESFLSECSTPYSF